MTTSKDLAEKLRVTMAETGITHVQLAEACQVRVPSVYDWLEHGRVHKKHLRTFARVFGKPLGYWLDDESEDDLDPDERQLLYLYRAISKRAKNRLLQEADYLKESEAPASGDEPPPPSSPDKPTGRRPPKSSP